MEVLSGVDDHRHELDEPAKTSTVDGLGVALRYDLKLWTGTLHESATYPPA
jgi:hypothetical protein